MRTSGSRHVPYLAAVVVAFILPLTVASARDPDRAVGIVQRAGAAGLGRTDTNWLVAIGVDRFNDPTVAPLRFCVADAKAIHEFFTSTGLVPTAQAHLLITDAPSRASQPSRINILEAVQYVATNASADSTILLSFSGHGFLDPGGESYLMPEDGRVSLLRDTAVSIARINEMLRKSKSRRKIVFVDACRNTPLRDGRGSDATPMSAKFLEALKAGEGQLTMASCGRGQKSLEMPEGPNGVFTYHLLRGLRGAAEADRRGLITLGNLQAYVARAVPDWCRQNRKPIQQPWMWGEMSVPIPLAVARPEPPVVTPAPTPRPTLITPTPRAFPKGFFYSAQRGDTVESVARKLDITVDDIIRHNTYLRPEQALIVGQQYWVPSPTPRPVVTPQPTPAIAMPSAMPRDKERSYTEPHAGLNLEMVWIPGGTFQMGSRLSAEDVAKKYGGRVKNYENEHPLHTVELDGFWLGKFEVTNAQFRKFLPSHSSKEYDGHSLDGDDQPVVYVSWEDAKAFCDWLSERSGKKYALPTEAQWEYACRAGTNTVRYWGDNDASMGQYANVADRTARQAFSYFNSKIAPTDDGYAVSAPVGRFRPNRFGLHDMLGNVFEWCADWYGPYESGRVRNPTGPATGTSRLLRGGTWSKYPVLVRSAYRYRSVPPFPLSLYGFRVCRAAPR